MPLPNRSKDILDAINKFYEHSSYFPVPKQLTKELGINKAMIYRYILQLEESGMIRRNDSGTIIATNIFPPPLHVTRTGKRK